MFFSSRRGLDAAPPEPRGRGYWLAMTAAGALVLTALDAVLLQQKKAFFTGGFLTVNYTRHAVEILAFAGISLLSDAAVLGVPIAAAWLLTSRVRLTPAARTVAVVSMATAPLLAADFLRYRLWTYLGDAFDLSLMYDLTGRNPEEFLAVSSTHLGLPLALIGVGGAGLGSLVWLLNRIPRGLPRTPSRMPPGLAGLGLVLFLGGLVASAAARQASETMNEGLRRKPSGSLLEWVTTRVTDLDRDGFGIGGTMIDPDPFDHRVFPYAVEIEGNGVDDNGVGGDLPPGLPPYEESAAARTWSRRPDVVLFVLESFRADLVGRTAGGKPVTPVLDGIAREGVSAKAVYSHNGYTAQSRFHTLAGSLMNLREGRTLIDDFKANGYEVAYFSGQDESFGGPGLGIGFERADLSYDARRDRGRRYSTFTTPGSLAVPFTIVQERIGEFLARRDRDRPLFLYVNFHDTHYPYHHDGVLPLVSSTVLREREIAPGRAMELRAMYDNTAANVDRAIGGTLELVVRHLARTPAVIVTADHGESLFDEGFLGHGYALNDAQTRIPLVAAGLPLRIDEPFGQAELRDAVGQALSMPAGSTGPVIVRTPGKLVFQYLGTIDRPRQIAFATATARQVFDFRTRRYQDDTGEWTRPEALDEAAREQFLELVRFWERMIRARGQIATTIEPE